MPIPPSFCIPVRSPAKSAGRSRASHPPRQRILPQSLSPRLEAFGTTSQEGSRRVHSTMPCSCRTGRKTVSPGSFPTSANCGRISSTGAMWPGGASPLQRRKTPRRRIFPAWTLFCQPRRGPEHSPERWKNWDQDSRWPPARGLPGLHARYDRLHRYRPGSGSA